MRDKGFFVITLLVALFLATADSGLLRQSRLSEAGLKFLKWQAALVFPPPGAPARLNRYPSP